MKIIMNFNIKILVGLFVIGIILVGGWWILKEQKTRFSKDEDLYRNIIPERPATIKFKLQVIEGLDAVSKYLENQNITVGLHYYTTPPPENFHILMNNLSDGKILELRAVSQETQKPVTLRGKFISWVSEDEGYSIYIGNSPESEWRKVIRIFAE